MTSTPPAVGDRAGLVAGGLLQSRIASARPGDIIWLEPGRTYIGHFVLPPRDDDDPRPITIRTSGPDAVPPGTRVDPARASALATLRSPDRMAALRTSPRTQRWRIELVTFRANRDGANEIIALGDGSRAQRTLEDVPSDLALDRLLIQGDPIVGQKRAIALNSARTSITNSHIEGIAAVGVDSQAIAGWNGPGDYIIANNYLEAAGENVLFGGADPAVPNLSPTGIVIRGNTLTKPAAWRSPAVRWQVKNLLELKNARGVVIEDNLFERSWAQAQSGYSILFTVRNQDGRCPWCQVEDVRFVGNVVRDVAAGIAIHGRDYTHPSRQTNRILIRNNLFEGMDRKWGGDGYLLQLTGNPRDVVVDHNTVVHGESGGLAKVDGVVEGFVFTNNLVWHGSYGIIASDRSPGGDSIRINLPGAVIEGNVIAGGNPAVYPPRNLFPTLEQFNEVIAAWVGGHDKLRNSTLWRDHSTDGLPPGVGFGRAVHAPLPLPSTM